MKWITHGGRGSAHSANGLWRIRNLRSNGEDCFAIWRCVDKVWLPVRTPSGKRTLYRRTMAAVKAYCEVEA